MALQQQQARKRQRLRSKTGMISVRQAAIKYNCSLKWIRDLLYAERLPGSRKIGRQWFIPLSELKSYKRLNSA